MIELNDELSNKCKIELTFFNLFVFNAESCKFFLLSFNSLVEQMINFVKHFHNRLLTRRVDDRIRVNSFYCFNSTNDETSSFIVVDYLSSCRDRIDAIMNASSRTKKFKFLKIQ